MKRDAFVTMLVALVILGGIIGGTLAGGIALGKNQGREEALQEFQGQMGQFTPPSGQGGIQFPGGPGIPLGSGVTMGAVEKVENNMLTINTPKGTVRVLVSGSTSIQKMAEGSLGDISSGQNIAVSGDKNDDGSIEAKSIYIISGLTFFGGGGQGQ